nr:hypothetical protein [Aquibium microcysteis]
MKVRIEPDGRIVQLDGRDAWAMCELVRAGERGCTPIDNPAPRWSAYTFKIRKAGFVVETVHEAHDGPFAGTHARYVLRTPVTVIDSGAAE